MTDYTDLIASMAPGASSSAAPGAPPGPSPEFGGAPSGAPSLAPVVPPAAAPAAEDNGYAGTIRDMDDARQSQAQTAVYQAKDANPDQAARAQALSQQLGVPSTAIEADLPTWEQRAALYKTNQTLQQNPQMADWLIANPEAARIAKDDYDNLSLVGRAASAFAQGWGQAAAGDEAGRQAWSGNTDAAAAIQKSLADAPIPGGPVGYTAKLVGGLLGGFADMVNHAKVTAVTGAALGGGLGAMATAPAGGAGAVPGAAAGFGVGITAGVVADAFKVGYGSLKMRLANVTDAAGNHLDPNVAEGAALAGGLVNGWLNGMGLRFGAAPSIAASGLISDALTAAVSRPTVQQALLSYGGSLVKAGGVGGALGVTMEGANLLSEQAAKVLSPGDFQTVFNNAGEREAAVQRLAQAAGDMAIGMGVMHGLPGTFGLGNDLAAARRSSSDIAMFQNLEGAVTGSKVRDRSTSLFQDWVQRQTDGTPVENLFIPAQRIADLYQSAGIEPGPDDPIMGKMAPDIASQLEQGRLTGGDVVIPTSAYLTHLAGTPVSEALRPDIRVRQDGMSLNEAQAFNEHYQKAMEDGRAQMEAADADSEGLRSSVQKVFDDVHLQSRQAGFTADAARQYAALFAARYAARGERMAQDPFELYQNEGLTIQQDLPESLRAKSADQLDVLINALKTSRGLPSDRKVYGPSLLEWAARRGGIEDSGGELAAMDADKWHRGKVGMPRLVREAPEDKGQAIPGMGSDLSAPGGHEHGLDSTTRAAWEAGYFPEHDKRPDIDHFLDAAREELAGKPRYAEGNLDHNALEFRGAVDDLDRHLTDMGIDPKKTSAADIRAAIEKHQAEGSGPQFDQPGTSAPTNRGSIRLGDGQAIISLFRARNLSTLLHESGHLFLDELTRDAQSPDAPKGIQDDMAAVLKWLGVSSADEIGTPHHEQFARGFEAYLMEGKAPSLALQPVFARFRAWLTNIYRTITGLNVAVSPEMHQVFDRLLATDDEIARAQQSQTPALFKTAADAGMTDAEFAAYTKSVERSREVAESTLLKKVMANIRRQKEASWKAEEAPLREQISGDVAKQPVYQALGLLRAGKLAGVEGDPVSMKLNKEAVARILGTDTALDMMPAGTMAAEGGVDPDRVAEVAGFRSGDDMVRALAGVEAKRKELRNSGDDRSPQSYDVDELVRSEMEARHGDALHDGSIETEALDAIHNERAMQTIATELRALARGPKVIDAGRGQRAAIGDVTPLEVVKRWAARAIGDKDVFEATRTHVYARDEAKAAGAAEAAILAGDREGAFKAKQQQLLNHALYVESLKASETVDGAVKMLDRFAALKSTKAMDQSYLDQIHDLISRFDFGRASQVMVDKRIRLSAWVDAQRAQGFDPPIPEALLDEANSIHYSRMKMDDFRGLVDSVESIAHIGRLKQKLLDAADERDFQAVVSEMVSTAGRLPQIEPEAVRNPAARGAGLAEFVRQVGAATKHVLKSADSSLIKMDQLFQWLDGRGNPGGVFQRVIMRRLSEAQTREHDLQAEYTAKLRKLGEDLPGASRKALSQRLTITELSDSATKGPSSMLKSELIAIALNIGNESNLDKLVRGEQWSEASIRSALDAHMTADDWHFVQGIWDTIEGLWPQIADLEKRLNGVAPEKVAPTEVRTPYGMLRGGYYPVVYDPLRSYMAEKNSPSDALFQNAYVRAATAQGHTETRTNAAAPLHLSLDVLPRHLQQVIHDLAWREAVMDVDRVTANPKVREAIDNAMGREYRQQIRPWLQSIANDKAYDPRGLAFWDKVAHWARTNATVVGLGFRLSTIAVHGTGAALNSVGEVGVRPMASAVSTFIKDPAGSRDFVFAKSGEMRNRLNEVDRDMRDAMGGELMGQSGALATVRRASMMGVAMIDMASALPTWLARYNTALKAGMADGDAVAAADTSVRNAHGAGAAKDHAAIQRGSEFQKLFTMFYSFWNHLYNRQRDLGRQAMAVRSIGDFGAVLGRSFFYLIAPPLIHGLISGGSSGPGDDQSWGAWAAEHIVLGLAGGVPILRDLVSAGESGRDYSVTPAAGGVAKVATSAKDLGRALGMIDGDPSDKWVKHAIEAPGYVFGLPLGQASGAGQYLWDVWKGDEDPDGVTDFLRGLMYGPKPERQQQ
jgi:hypothetical protein